MTWVECPHCKKEINLDATVNWDIKYSAKEETI